LEILHHDDGLVEIREDYESDEEEEVSIPSKFSGTSQIIWRVIVVEMEIENHLPSHEEEAERMDYLQRLIELEKLEEEAEMVQPFPSHLRL
jgi:hypothetical protein